MEPINPITAVTHPNPYPYYSRLRAGPPLYFDEALRLWVATRATLIAEMFASEAGRVRPIAEPVPTALYGRPAGDIFSRLMRMTDGSCHDQPKMAFERALMAISPRDVSDKARQAALRAAPTSLDPAELNAWVFDTPVAAVCDLLGFPVEERLPLVEWTRQFVACLSPLSTSDQLSTANMAAALLRSRVHSFLDSSDQSSRNVTALIRGEAAKLGWVDESSLVANFVGLLSQTYEATAGLIGNAIVALATQPGLLGKVRMSADGWDQLVHETSRYDSPIQNTRRFVVEPTTIGGVELVPGAVVLLVLAAANRDPQANPDPDVFHLVRPNRCVFSFSRGVHACPGQAVARNIAATALSALFEEMTDDVLALLAWTWKPSTNGRMPVFKDPDPIGRS